MTFAEKTEIKETTEARNRDPYRLEPELQIESISHNNTNHDIKTSVSFHACTFNTFFRKVISQKIYKSIITCLYECILMKHSFHSIIYYNLVDCRASKYISLTSNSYSPFIINFFFALLPFLQFKHEEITIPIISIVIIF